MRAAPMNKEGPFGAELGSSRHLVAKRQRNLVFQDKKLRVILKIIAAIRAIGTVYTRCQELVGRRRDIDP
jgi:hypothetical protein